MFCAPINANHSNQCQYHGNPRLSDVDVRIKHFVKGIFAAFIAKVSFSLHPAAFSVIGLPVGIIASIYAIHSLSVALLPCAYSENRISYIEYWELTPRVRVPYIHFRNMFSSGTRFFVNINNSLRAQVGSRTTNQRMVTRLNQNSFSRNNSSFNASPVPVSVYREKTNTQNAVSSFSLRREEVGSRATNNQRQVPRLNQSSSFRSNSSSKASPVPASVYCKKTNTQNAASPSSSRREEVGSRATNNQRQVPRLNQSSSNASPVPANVYCKKVRRSDNASVGSSNKRNLRGRAPVGIRG